MTDFQAGKRYVFRAALVGSLQNLDAAGNDIATIEANILSSLSGWGTVGYVLCNATENRVLNDVYNFRIGWTPGQDFDASDVGGFILSGANQHIHPGQDPPFVQHYLSTETGDWMFAYPRLRLGTSGDVVDTSSIVDVSSRGDGQWPQLPVEVTPSIIGATGSFLMLDRQHAPHVPSIDGQSVAATEIKKATDDLGLNLTEIVIGGIVVVAVTVVGIVAVRRFLS